MTGSGRVTAEAAVGATARAAKRSAARTPAPRAAKPRVEERVIGASRGYDDYTPEREEWIGRARWERRQSVDGFRFDGRPRDAGASRGRPSHRLPTNRRTVRRSVRRQ